MLLCIFGPKHAGSVTRSERAHISFVRDMRHVCSGAGGRGCQWVGVPSFTTFMLGGLHPAHGYWDLLLSIQCVTKTLVPSNNARNSVPSFGSGCSGSSMRCHCIALSAVAMVSGGTMLPSASRMYGSCRVGSTYLSTLTGFLIVMA